MFEVHDNIVKSYFIDLEKMEIQLNLANEDEDSKQQVFFNKVFAYYFYNELSGSILYDIEKEKDIDFFLERNREILSNQQGTGWPMIYEKEDELFDYIKENNYECYLIEPSYGLRGWVVCQDVVVRKCM
ncbi:hypothetical protein Q2T76_02990 [Lactobacillus sp. YT155]|uniref:hypothetical protein n=1 Tax=Lactobacillus sp. YT155 TaxID=3060955 RepID=UPI00265F1CBD|nr:hypothetical protein [Lactobacillus sp. YT155]MDO1605018.1 hypothetical protein [Lactobacillus sp. YT155]